MNKLTDEQIKELWELCGFRLKRLKNDTPYYVLNDPEGKQYNYWIGKYRGEKLPVDELYPNLKLNSLFKYAVPKLQKENVMVTLVAHEKGGFRVLIRRFLPDDISELPSITNSNDPAVALSCAIYKALKGEKP